VAEDKNIDSATVKDLQQRLEKISSKDPSEERKIKNALIFLRR